MKYVIFIIGLLFSVTCFAFPENIYSVGKSQGVQVGHAHYQLVNPVGSGVVIEIKLIVATVIGAGGFITIRSYGSPLDNSMTSLICNVNFGVGGAKAEAYFEKIDNPRGSQHADFYLAANTPFHLPIIGPFLTEGEGMLVVFHTSAQSVVNIEWEEIDTNLLFVGGIL